MCLTMRDGSSSGCTGPYGLAWGMILMAADQCMCPLRFIQRRNVVGHAAVARKTPLPADAFATINSCIRRK